jgi:hypothetical protein
MRRFLAVLRSFFHSSLLYTFSCHVYLVPPLSRVLYRFIYNNLLGILFSSILCTCPNQRNLCQCYPTAGPRPGTGPWHQFYRAARGKYFIVEIKHGSIHMNDREFSHIEIFERSRKGISLFMLILYY